MTHRPRLGRAAVVASILVLALSAGPVAAAKPGGVGGGGGGKPGYPDRVTWSGFEWQVKTSTSAVGPGPNVFSRANVGVDEGTDELTLSITQQNGKWTAAEIIGPHLGYGTYTFTVESNVSSLDPNVVLGLFTWSDRARFAHREIDIEVARWGEVGGTTNAQFVVQPWDIAGHLERYSISASGPTVHSFTWRPGSVEFVSAGTTWVYAGSDVPPSQDERIRINLWLFGGRAPMDGNGVIVRLSSFTFTPAL